MVNRNRPGQYGFTLIELLVVIAIIAILAAILFPVFASARAKARQTSCLSNTKQISLAFASYNQDWDEGFPATVTERQSPASVADTSANMAAYSIQQILFPYTKSTAIWKCPEDAAWPTPAAGDWYPSDYGCHLNEGLLGAGTQGVTHYADYSDNVSAGATIDLTDFGFNQDTPLSTIQYPDLFLLCADSYRTSDGGPSRGGIYPQPWAFSAPTQSQLNPTHTSGSNIAFADGHSKWYRPEQTWTSYTNNFWRRDPTPGS